VAFVRVVRSALPVPVALMVRVPLGAIVAELMLRSSEEPRMTVPPPVRIPAVMLKLSSAVREPSISMRPSLV